MNTLGILLEQIGLFVIYMVTGILLIKTKVLNSNTVEVLARFVLKLALPVMIFTNTVNGVTREMLGQSLSILAFTVLLYGLLFFLAKAMAGVFGMKGDRAQVYRAMFMFGNIGFMGIPIISSIFPENGMVYISVFTIVDQMVLWTVGVKLTTPSGEGKFKPSKLINPALVATVLAVILVCLKLPLPGLLNTALQKIGGTATPLAMIYMGGVFACTDIRAYFKKKELYGIVLVKMIAFPILFFLLLGLFPTSEEIRMTMALLGAMPVMTSIVMMARSSGSEGDYAMGGVLVTTICGIATLPLVCWILQSI